MTIRVPQLNKTLRCEEGENLFRTLREQGLPIASSCKGEGVCGKCVVSINKGTENLSPPTELELKLHATYKYSLPQRISCQCRVLGDIEIKTTYW